MRRVHAALTLLSAALAPAIAAPAGAETPPGMGPMGRPYAARGLALPAGATSSAVAAVNASGLMAGEVTIGGVRHAALWDAAGQMRDLGAPEGGESWAVDVADNGWTAGTAHGADGVTWAWVWTGSGGLRRLDGFDDRPTEAVALNRSGQVAVRGHEGDKGGWYGRAASAWLWTPGVGARRLPGLGGWRDEPIAINDAGQLVGSSAPNEGYPEEVVYWNAAGDVTAVTGPMAEVLYVTDADIDEAGTIAGLFYGYPEGGPGDGTFAWDAKHGLYDGSFVYLGWPDADNVVMNDRRQVASMGEPPGDGDSCVGEQATLWTIGEQPQLLPVGSCFSGSKAINDVGEVAGTGGIARGWVWDGRKVHTLPEASYQIIPRDPVAVLGMNDAGTVIGTTQVDASYRAMSWSAPGGSVTAWVTASADTYVHRALPGQPLGSEWTLAAGGDADYLGLMRFSVPPTPAGRHLVAARLHLHTSSQSYAGSAVAHQVRLTTGQWSESSTWTTRPRLGEVLDRTFVGAAGADQEVASYLDTRKVHPGRDLNLAVTGEGPDSVWWYSRESAPQTRPTLELIYR